MSIMVITPSGTREEVEGYRSSVLKSLHLKLISVLKFLSRLPHPLSLLCIVHRANLVTTIFYLNLDGLLSETIVPLDSVYMVGDRNVDLLSDSSS